MNQTKANNNPNSQFTRMTNTYIYMDSLALSIALPNINVMYIYFFR